jgi:hypothetical protein
VSDSCSLETIIADELLAQGLHRENVGAGLVSDEKCAELIAKHSLAALRTAIRNNPKLVIELGGDDVGEMTADGEIDAYQFVDGPIAPAGSLVWVFVSSVGKPDEEAG